MVHDDQQTEPAPEGKTSGAIDDALVVEATGADQVAEAKNQADEIKVLQELLEEERTKAKEYLDQWRRTAADFANYRKRQEREQQQMVTMANGTLLSMLLPVLDDLERALGELPAEAKESAWAEGVKLIESKMRLVFERAGLEEIPTKEGQLFDPSVHEAVLYEENVDCAEGSIVQVVQRGYRLGERVLRPTLVKVAKSSLARPQQEQG